MGLFALFDGHAGWETSAWLSKNLVPAVVGSLADLYSKYAESDAKTKKSSKSQQDEIISPPPNAVDDTIKDTFKRLDDDIVHAPLERVFASPSKDAAVNLLAPANAGSCALLAFYDPQTRLLRIALTGDLRAVLGRRKTDDDGNITYDVHVLSADQNAYNKDEEQRMQAQHPGEEIMKNGRVLGWGPSRAFGDARMKWNLDIQARLKKEYLGRTPYKNVKTPPYFTAEPEITTTEVKPGDFLILATDGLWESLSNPEAVGLVGMWLSHNERERKGLGHDDGTSRFAQWSAKKQFVSVDHNAATHLVRNALGGADKDLTAALLSINSPRSRSYMDDITATVVFFDDK
ncbi:hypothetical protein SERLA73DRAFT_112739 [Serpula lacrymans var. lacrymans S7.3]|uniref:PPM-type phosphatase domain-containing protein n=1 Tax=Serpula lacrymans var. lacrymans (strain S7.3) TaxID=936435 RepID=F8Q5H6_SERL3|nr:hypothetical protein SERLA73DRAFT_112739 [Serpula lacrymans var. lacrymans S7.3]